MIIAENIDILAFNEADLKTYFKSQNLPAFRAAQVFDWLQNKALLDFEQMANLPLSLRQDLAAAFSSQIPQIEHISANADTQKFLLKLADNQTIETVAMYYQRANSRDRATCCVSTQSGCAMGCAFCASGLFKDLRNLSAGEIVAQVLLSSQLAIKQGFKGISNIVFMGMGEPLANLANLKQAILILNDPQGQNIGQRRMTVSTCGLVPQIYQVADWDLQINLAISLHSANQAKRQKIMPIAAKHDLNDLMKACDHYRQKTGRRLTFEYAMFKGINDSLDDAKLLADLLTGRDILVNIIAANIVSESKYQPSNKAAIKQFCDYLQSRNCEVALRERRGQDIDAACGQLRKRLAFKNKSEV